MQLLLTNTAVVTDARERQKLFSGSMETWILILPLLALPAFLLEQITGVHWNALDWNMSSFVVSSIGLSSLHNYFTIAMLFGLPEFQGWSQDQLTAKPILFRLRTYGVVISIFLLTFIVYDFWRPLEALAGFIGIGFTLMSAHHSIAQSLGLSQAYTAQMVRDQGLNEEERERLHLYQAVEIKLKKIIVPLQFIWAATIFVPQFIGAQFPVVNALESYRSVALAAFVLMIAAFLINCFLISSLRPTNKLVFSLRLILYACAVGSSSLALVFFLRLIHAIEYWGVFQSITERSAAPTKTKSNLMWVTITLSLVGLFLLLFRRTDGFFYYFAGAPSETHWIVPLLAATSLSMTHIHFFLDGLIFRMRDPISRKWIAPLLLPK